MSTNGRGFVTPPPISPVVPRLTTTNPVAPSFDPPHYFYDDIAHFSPKYLHKGLSSSSSSNQENNIDYSQLICKEDIAIVDGKCNQLQNELFHCEERLKKCEVNATTTTTTPPTTRNSRYFKTKKEKEEEEAAAAAEILKQMKMNKIATEKQCLVTIKDNCFEIYNYSMYNIGRLIGKKGDNIRGIENTYKIKVDIPKCGHSGNFLRLPIRISPRYLQMCNLMEVFNGINKIVSILEIKISQ